MAITKKSFASIPVGVLVGLVITSMLFIAIPLLTKISTMKRDRKVVHRVMISSRKPPPPPEPEQEKRIEEKQKQEAPKQDQKRQKMSRPKLNLAMTGLSAGMGGTIQIGGMLNSDFEVSDSLFVTAFKLSEVDQPPRATKRMNPQYPFEARAKGVEAKVLVRFVVDSEGNVKEPRIEWVKPETEYDEKFKEKALAAINRFRFRPAKLNGKFVDVICLQPFNFKPVD